MPSSSMYFFILYETFFAVELPNTCGSHFRTNPYHYHSTVQPLAIVLTDSGQLMLAVFVEVAQWWQLLLHFL